MFKKSMFVLLTLGLAACSNGAPSEADVKQALYRYYEMPGSSAELKQALGTEVGVGECKKEGDAYRCQIQNKALNTSNPMLFSYDKSTKQWKFVKEGS